MIQILCVTSKSHPTVFKENNRIHIFVHLYIGMLHFFRAFYSCKTAESTYLPNNKHFFVLETDFPLSASLHPLAHPIPILLIYPILLAKNHQKFSLDSPGRTCFTLTFSPIISLSKSDKRSGFASGLKCI